MNFKERQSSINKMLRDHPDFNYFNRWYTVCCATELCLDTKRPDMDIILTQLLKHIKKEVELLEKEVK